MSFCSPLGDANLEPCVKEVAPDLCIAEVHFPLWNRYTVYGLFPLSAVLLPWPPCAWCSHHSGLYSSVTFSRWALGTYSQVACKALCALPLAGSWTHLEQTSLPCGSPATLSTFQCLEGDVLPSVKDVPGTHGSPSYPVIPFSSFRVKLGSFPEGCLPGLCSPVWVKSHFWMFPRCHISFLCCAHHTWNFPFYLGDYHTHFCLPLRS